MTIAVFAYNFPHWKTQNGLLNLVANGIVPSVVILQDRKELNVPQSKYKVTPTAEYLQEPVAICKALNLDYVIHEHNNFLNIKEYDLGVILGARILSQELIQRFPKGVLNIHPGILPGNRGLDNLKHSIVNNLPIGVTAHLIDHRIDMGTILSTKEVPVFADDTIRDVYNRQRNYEQQLLISTLKRGEFDGVPCEHSEKFDIINSIADSLIEILFEDYKQLHS